ncbi:MAG: YIP1 family protein [Thermodesulfobacteriota bacterium]
MKVSCPHCNFSKEIDTAQIPDGAKYATCPKCHQKFPLSREQAPAAASPRSAQGPRGESTTIPSLPPSPDSSDIVLPQVESSDAGLEGLEETRAEEAPGPPPLPSRGLAAPDQGMPWLGAARGIPWEQRPGSFFGDLWANTRQVLFSPGRFFTALPVTGGYKAPLLYSIIIGTLGLVFYYFWYLLMVLVTGTISDQMPDLPMPIMLGIFAGLLIITPIILILGLYIGAAILHVLLMIVRGADGGYEATFRVMAYSTAAQIFNLVPFLGGMVSGIYALVLMIIGLPKAHQTTVGRVLVAILVIPIGFIMLLAILGVVLALVLARV